MLLLFELLEEEVLETLLLEELLDETLDVLLLDELELGIISSLQLRKKISINVINIFKVFFIVSF